MSGSQTGFTYLHHTARDFLAPQQVLPDFIFGSAETCRSYMARCLRDPEDHVVLEGTWDDLGYPECMEVAHPEQIDGAVGQAGVRLRDFYKLHRVRTTPAQAKVERVQRRADRREMAACARRGELPF